MKNLKEQFNEFRSNTPKHVQWILLGAAFVIVIILLTLILTYNSKTDEDISDSNQQVSFNITPNSIDFSDVIVGESESEKVKITVDVPVIISNVTIPDVEFKTPNNCVEDLINECEINVSYVPTKARAKSDIELQVTWYQKGQEKTPQTEKIPVSFSAKAQQVAEPVIETQPVIEPEPVVEPEPVPEDDEEEIEETEYENPVKEIRKIAEPNPFNEPEKKPVLTAERCSEFAFPGYDTSGRQIGWIKPEHGANYFHPFSDKDCSNPTGKYDFTTGIITSLADGSKIGTDSDHIGYRNVRSRNLTLPQLSAPQTNSAHPKGGKFGADAQWVATDKDNNQIETKHDDSRKFDRNKVTKWDRKALLGSGYSETPEKAEAIVSSRPYDRTFILRQFKPIPATIVSEVRADPSVYGCSNAKGGECDSNKNYSVPVRATVDRNVYSDDGRTIILPTGTLLMGYLDGDLPGPYQAFGRMNIKWYQFIRPDGVEFNFKENQDPYSADAQGRMGVPGHGSTDYVEQMVMPILTALVPAAVNMIAPITDTVINQIDLDNNTIVQSGTIRSSEMAKQDIINTWNKITQKLLVDTIDNTVPPFSIAAGTRINVFSPVDLIVTCGDDKVEEDKNIKGFDITGKKCAFVAYGSETRRKWSDLKEKVKNTANDASWEGQIRSFNLNQYCAWDNKKNKVTIKDGSEWAQSGYDYRTVLAYCESQNYQAINNAKNAAYSANVQKQAQEKQQDYGISGYEWSDTDGLIANTTGQTDEQLQKYNTEVLGLTYDDDGNLLNPFSGSNGAAEEGLTCEDGSAPDSNGCCTGEIYTDMGDSYVDDSGSHFACCPDDGGDCFPPLDIE